MYIYALIDPRNFEPFYIGSTSSPVKVRLMTHICDAKNFRKTLRIREHSIKKNTLIMDIINNGLNVSAVILYKCSEKDAVYYEKYFYSLLIKGNLTLYQSKGISR